MVSFTKGESLIATFSKNEILFRFGHVTFRYVSNAACFEEDKRMIHSSFPSWIVSKLDRQTAIKVEAIHKPNCSLEWFSVLLQNMSLALGKDGWSIFHGGALERAKSLFLVAGMSGAGKSTVCMGLSKNGFKLLADDMIFLRFCNQSVSVIPVPKLVYSRSLLFQGVMGIPEDPSEVTFPVERTRVLLPKFAQTYSVTPSPDLETNFRQLTAGNLFGGLAGGIDSVRCQLRVRKRLAMHHPVSQVTYSDDHASGFSHLTRDLNLS